MTYPTAQEMREVTDAKVEMNVKPYLDVIFEKMKKSKSNSINMIYLYHDTGLDFPNGNEESSIRTELSKLGYTVKHNPDPDPGHPCSCGSYYSIHW